MTEFRHVSFNLGATQIAATERLLRAVGITSEASLHTGGVLAGLCRVMLKADDVRLPALLDALRTHGETPLITAERRYNESELDRVPWLLLRVNTAGLLGGANMNQPYDHTRACRTCGAGAEPVPPLLARLTSMGRKPLDRTAHDGHLVVTTHVARAITSARLTGVETLPVTRAPEKSADPGFQWLRITTEWGPLAQSSVIATEDLCPSCRRAGHFDTTDRVTELRYSEPPSAAADFNRTWEYFGVWRPPASSDRAPVGGAQYPIVSQRVRRLVRGLRVPRVSFEPVWLPETAGAESQ